MTFDEIAYGRTVVFWLKHHIPWPPPDMTADEAALEALQESPDFENYCQVILGGKIALWQRLEIGIARFLNRMAWGLVRGAFPDIPDKKIINHKREVE